MLCVEVLVNRLNVDNATGTRVLAKAAGSNSEVWTLGQEYWNRPSLIRRGVKTDDHSLFRVVGSVVTLNEISRRTCGGKLEEREPVVDKSEERKESEQLL